MPLSLIFFNWYNTHESNFINFHVSNKEKAKQYDLTILPLGVLSGHADEYSKPVWGSITGCSPITPIPLK